MSSRVEETKTLETLHDPSDLHPVQNPKPKSCEVEKSKTLRNLHNPSGLYPVWNPQTSVSCEVKDAKTLETLHDPSAHWEFCPKFLSINSCCTSKKLEYRLKIVKIIDFLTLKPIKGTLGFILEIMKKNARWRHKSEIHKRNLKTMISPLLFCL
jgi:hypothetical protein